MIDPSHLDYLYGFKLFGIVTLQSLCTQTGPWLHVLLSVLLLGVNRLSSKICLICYASLLKLVLIMLTKQAYYAQIVPRCNIFSSDP